MAIINVTAGTSVSFGQSAPEQRALLPTASTTITFSGAIGRLSPLKLLASTLTTFVGSASLARSIKRTATTNWNVLQSTWSSIVRSGGRSVTAGSSLSFGQRCVKGRLCTAATMLLFRSSSSGMAGKPAANRVTFAGIASVKIRRTMTACNVVRFRHAFLLYQS
jgi:hypothetical protein